MLLRTLSPFWLMLLKYFSWFDTNIFVRNIFLLGQADPVRCCLFPWQLRTEDDPVLLASWSWTLNTEVKRGLKNQSSWWWTAHLLRHNTLMMLFKYYSDDEIQILFWHCRDHSSKTPICQHWRKYPDLDQKYFWTKNISEQTGKLQTQKLGQLSLFLSKMLSKRQLERLTGWWSDLDWNISWWCYCQWCNI